MDQSEVERKVQNVLRRDEPRIIKALELYYQNFRGNGTGMTLGSAACLAKANPAYIPNYLCKYEGLGMPSDREEALKYLRKLKELRP